MYVAVLRLLSLFCASISPPTINQIWQKREKVSVDSPTCSVIVFFCCCSPYRTFSPHPRLLLYFCRRAARGSPNPPERPHTAFRLTGQEISGHGQRAARGCRTVQWRGGSVQDVVCFCCAPRQRGRALRSFDG